MRRQLKANAKWVVAIITLVAGAAISIGYVLSQQNLSFPWDDTYVVEAEFAGAAGLEPGLGQPVNVAGVRVGTIRDVRLREGHAVARLEIDTGKLPAVYSDARATLIPTTALKDLRIDVVPGTRAAGELSRGGTIPVARTTPPIDADDLLSALDRDTRDFFAVLVSETGRATAGRGGDLRRLLKALGPTAAQLRGISRTLARRQTEVRRLVTNLATISATFASNDRPVREIVSGASATVGALAAEREALEQALGELPSTLAAAESTLRGLPAFAAAARPAIDELMPAVRRLPAALDAMAPLAREAGPITRDRLRPLVSAAQPLARDLDAITPALSRVTPYLTSAFKVLTYAVNEIGFNPEGDDEGLLFWLSWAAHNINSVTSSGDAHGAVARAVALFDCGTVTEDPLIAPVVAALSGGAVPSCPGGGS